MQVVLVYLQWFRRRSLLKCVSQDEIAKNSLKTPIFGVEDRSRSSMLVSTERSSTVVVIIRSKSVSICKKTVVTLDEPIVVTLRFLRRGAPLWCRRSRGISSPGSTKFAHKKLETLRYNVVKTRNQESLSHMGLNRYQVVTDRQTDGRTDRITTSSTRLRA